MPYIVLVTWFHLVMECFVLVSLAGCPFYPSTNVNRTHWRHSFIFARTVPSRYQLSKRKDVQCVRSFNSIENHKSLATGCLCRSCINQSLSHYNCCLDKIQVAMKTKQAVFGQLPYLDFSKRCLVKSASFLCHESRWGQYMVAGKNRLLT